MNDNSTNSLATSVSRFLAILLGAFFVTIIVAFPIMWVWNWLITSIFEVRAITWTEALGLFCLARILFGSETGRSSSKEE